MSYAAALGVSVEGSAKLAVGKAYPDTSCYKDAPNTAAASEACSAQVGATAAAAGCAAVGAGYLASYCADIGAAVGKVVGQYGYAAADGVASGIAAIFSDNPTCQSAEAFRASSLQLLINAGATYLVACRKLQDIQNQAADHARRQSAAAIKNWTFQDAGAALAANGALKSLRAGGHPITAQGQDEAGIVGALRAAYPTAPIRTVFPVTAYGGPSGGRTVGQWRIDKPSHVWFTNQGWITKDVILPPVDLRAVGFSRGEGPFKYCAGMGLSKPDVDAWMQDVAAAFGSATIGIVKQVATATAIAKAKAAAASKKYQDEQAVRESAVSAAAQQRLLIGVVLAGLAVGAGWYVGRRRRARSH